MFLEKNKKPILVLAPMAGITDLPFRIICRQFGADILYSEMISTAGLFYNPEKSLALAKSNNEDDPFFIQLFGSNPSHFKNAVKLISKLNNKNKLTDSRLLRRPEGIDINFGCPVKKVMKQNSGCALMRDPNLSYEIIKTVTKSTNLPVSIKIRAGIDKITALKFLNKVKDLNWKMVIIHGRTYAEGFSGEIDFKLIKEVKEEFTEKLVVANGGIFNPEKAKETLDKTGADGVAVARGTYGNPWIFKQIRSYLKTGVYSTPDIKEIKEVAWKHAKLMHKIKGGIGIIEMRKHLSWYFKGVEKIKEIRKDFMQVENLDQIKNLIQKI